MSDDSPHHDLLNDLTADEAELLEDILSDLGNSRRTLIGQTSTAALEALVLQFLAKRNAFAGTEDLFSASIADENAVKVAFRVNGMQKSLTLDSRVTLLDARTIYCERFGAARHRRLVGGRSSAGFCIAPKNRI